jgi:hypothetical protein
VREEEEEEEEINFRGDVFLLKLYTSLTIVFYFGRESYDWLTIKSP